MPTASLTGCGVPASATTTAADGEWTGFDDWLHAPPTFADFYAQYHDYAAAIVVKLAAGCPSAARETDDITAEILTRLCEVDILAKFDPNRGTRFAAFFSRHVYVYARGKVRGVVRRGVRFPVVADAPVGRDGGGDATTADRLARRSGETAALSGRPTALAGELEGVLVPESVRDTCAAITARAPAWTVPVVEAMARGAITGDSIAPGDLAETLGWTRPRVRAALDEIRAAAGTTVPGMGDG